MQHSTTHVFLVVKQLLLVDPALGARGPLSETLGEPESDLIGSSFVGVGTVAQVSADVETVVTTDGARGGLRGASSSQELTALGEGVKTLEDHSNDGAGAHEGDKTSEEGLGLQVTVVLLPVLTRRLGQLHGNELESLLLESKRVIHDM